MKLLGPRLREIRKAKGLSQVDVAMGAAMTPSMISEFERGIGDPSITTLRRLAAYYGLSMSQLFEDDPTPRGPSKQQVEAILNEAAERVGRLWP